MGMMPDFRVSVSRGNHGMGNKSFKDEKRLMICRGCCGHWQEWEGIRTFTSHYGGQA